MKSIVGCLLVVITSNFSVAALFPVSNEKGKIGYCNENGEIVIPFRFDEANLFSCGAAAVVKDGDLFYIDEQGQDHQYLRSWSLRSWSLRSGLDDRAWSKINNSSFNSQGYAFSSRLIRPEDQDGDNIFEWKCFNNQGRIICGDKINIGKNWKCVLPSMVDKYILVKGNAEILIYNIRGVCVFRERIDYEKAFLYSDGVLLCWNHNESKIWYVRIQNDCVVKRVCFPLKCLTSYYIERHQLFLCINDKRDCFFCDDSMNEVAWSRDARSIYKIEAFASLLGALAEGNFVVSSYVKDSRANGQVRRFMGVKNMDGRLIVPCIFDSVSIRDEMIVCEQGSAEMPLRNVFMYSHSGDFLCSFKSYWSVSVKDGECKISDGEYNWYKFRVYLDEHEPSVPVLLWFSPGRGEVLYYDVQNKAVVKGRDFLSKREPDMDWYCRCLH